MSPHVQKSIELHFEEEAGKKEKNSWRKKASSRDRDHFFILRDGLDLHREMGSISSLRNGINVCPLIVYRQQIIWRVGGYGAQTNGCSWV
eukprot:1157600-Pelagomonas_calceolata.AAC.3